MQEKKDVDILDYYLMTQSHWYDDIIMMYHQSAAETFSFLAEGRLLELDVKTCQQNTIYYYTIDVWLTWMNLNYFVQYNYLYC